MATQPVRRKYQPIVDKSDRQGKELLSTTEYITRRSEPGQFVPMRRSQVRRGNFGKLRARNFEELVDTRLHTGKNSVKTMFEELNRFVEAHCGTDISIDHAEMAGAILKDEVEVFKRSFRRGLAYRFALDITNRAHLSLDHKYQWLLETKLAQLLSSLDELRNCAEQERNEYYVDQLLEIYATLDGFVNEFVRKTQTPGYTDVRFNVERSETIVVKGKRD